MRIRKNQYVTFSYDDNRTYKVCEFTLYSIHRLTYTVKSIGILKTHSIAVMLRKDEANSYSDIESKVI